ncbi:hypothetical protein [Endozoicomonas atrinae]|uniref:hypothetical protein n=1 Tax=Endozoicomonas atrinae TaxID=1333660 RepID=UPI003B00C1E0
MSTPQIPAQSLVFQTQLPDAPVLNKDGAGHTTTATFNARDVSHSDISKFFVRVTPGEARQFAEDTCAEAERVHGDKIWNKDNLYKDLKAYELPTDFGRRDGLKERKPSAILNVYLKVKNEGEKAVDRGGDGHTLPLAQNLCDLLNRKEAKEGEKKRDPHFVNMEFFVGQMNKYHHKMDPKSSVSNIPGHDLPGVKEPSLPPAENPEFDYRKQPPIPSEGAANNSVSAPPCYEISEVEKVPSQLPHLEACISGLMLVDAEKVGEKVIWIESELGRIGRLPLSEDLSARLSVINARLEEFKLQQRVDSEMSQVEQYDEKIDELEVSLKKIDKSTENNHEVKSLERKIDSLTKQKIDRLTSVEEEKRRLQSRVEELRGHIDQWRRCACAKEDVEHLESQLRELCNHKEQKSMGDVDLLSTGINKFVKQVKELPFGDDRYKCLGQASKLKVEMNEAKEQIARHQLNEALKAAESHIVVLERDTTTIPEQHFMTLVREKLNSVTSLLVVVSYDEVLEMRDNLEKRFKNLQDRCVNGQGSASKTAPSSQIQGETIVNNIQEIFDKVEALISTLETDPNPPRERHLTNIDTYLNKVKDQLTKLVGREFESDRDGLQTTYSNLVQRQNELRGKVAGINQGQGSSDINVLRLNRLFLNGIAKNLSSCDISRLMFLIDIPNQQIEKIKRSADDAIALLQYLESRVTVAELIGFMQAIGRQDIAGKILEYKDD